MRCEKLIFSTSNIVFGLLRFNNTKQIIDLPFSPSVSAPPSSSLFFTLSTVTEKYTDGLDYVERRLKVILDEFCFIRDIWKRKKISNIWMYRIILILLTMQHMILRMMMVVRWWRFPLRPDTFHQFTYTIVASLLPDQWSWAILLYHANTLTMYTQRTICNAKYIALLINNSF